MIDLCRTIMLDRPFVWGKSDCVTCAADVFASSYGVDPVAEIRGRWKTRREAQRLLDAIGGWKEGFPFMFESAGLVQGDKVGAICITLGQSPGLAIKAGDNLYLGKSINGMVVVGPKNVWRSWCLR